MDNIKGRIGYSTQNKYLLFVGRLVVDKGIVLKMFVLIQTHFQ